MTGPRDAWIWSFAVLKADCAGGPAGYPDMSRRAVLGAFAAGVAGLVGAATPEPVSARPFRAFREVRLADFGGGPQVADNSAALRGALAELSRAGGGVVRLAAGTHRFLSSALGQRGIVLPSDIMLRGAGREQTILAITGETVCNLFVATNVSRIAIEDMAIIGNNIAMAGATIYGSGGAVRWVLDAQATAGVSDFTLRRVHLENFRGPHWVAIENATGLDAGREMSGVDITDVTFRSRPGNCVGTDNISLNAAALCVDGHAGVIRDINVSLFSGDARHIKTGIILYHAVLDAVLDRVTVANAGRDGINDDVGAYAIQIYDKVSRMTGVTIRNPVVVAPRSAGIYVASATGVSIVDPVISGQTDRRDADLPKGAIVFNGTRQWSVEGGRLSDNWRDLHIVPHASGDAAAPAIIDGRVSGVRAEGGENGILIHHARGHAARGIMIRDCRWRTRGRTVLIDNIQDPQTVPAKAGYVSDIAFQNCRFDAGAGARALEIWGAPGLPAGDFAIEGCSLSGTNPLFALDIEGPLRVRKCDVRDLGTMPGMSAASLRNCGRLDLGDATFRSPGRQGIGIDLGGSKGTVHGLQFVGASRTLPAGDDVPQLGRGRPAFACDTGQSIQNLERAADEPAAWRCLGGRRWGDS